MRYAIPKLEQLFEKFTDFAEEAKIHRETKWSSHRLEIHHRPDIVSDDIDKLLIGRKVSQLEFFIFTLESSKFEDIFSKDQ